MTTIRAMTWNMHSAFQLNPGFDLAAAIAIIRKWSPDILALQEVDSRGRQDSPFLKLQEAIGGHSVGAKSIVAADGEYGQMLISRWPWAAEPHIADLSYPEREPRRAIGADIVTPRGVVHVVATHLGLSIRERHAQTRALLGLAASPNPTVVMGDFNDWFWINSVRSALARRLPERTRHRTFPAVWPLMRLDRIYVSGARIGQSRTDPEGARVSDHLPVIAELVLD